ncbi:MAG: hypothetical protein ACOY3P_13845 [Planctomycetota bacterium]
MTVRFANVGYRAISPVFGRDSPKWWQPALVVLLACAASNAAAADEFDFTAYPHTVIRRGGIELLVYLPDAEKGINRAMRFDRSGFVARASHKGHTWFGPWHATDDPYRNDNVMGTAGEFGMGTNGMPPPLGFAEAAEGEPFIKIGVGVLKKKGVEYRFNQPYELVSAADWAVQTEPGVASFKQVCSSAGRFAYRYAKRIAICERPPGFVIEYELENTGTKPIEQTYYAHNFIQIDDQPIGPEYRFTFPQPMTPDRDMKGIASVEGSTLAFLRPMQTGESVYAQFREHDLPAAANGVLAEHVKHGVGLRITGTAPLARYHFWAMERVACPEPFVALNVEPGETFRWKDTYELIVAP